MKNTIVFILISIFIIAVFVNANISTKGNQSKNKNLDSKNDINGIVVKDIDGNDVNLSDYKGKVLLIVNVASKCGYTPQYKGLESLYEKYKDKGFEILAFPCNDFGGQEPGTNEEIKDFCSSNFNVKFKLFDKIKVLGSEKSPLYEVLTNNDVTGKGEIKWNFEKFLISKDGKIISRYPSNVEPESRVLIDEIEKQINSAM
ncbi:MAG TPA: glutathione peroxidase [Ignavibacteriaceae bacterium]|nr:glutathione peroxidase [Ignavibacteriaceae bacterium]